jgi:DNA-binding NarL/FixJ family response regulator
MIRVLVVADSGQVMDTLTRSLQAIERVDIVGYANGRSPVDAIVRSIHPDVVLVDEMRWPVIALTRVSEICEAVPAVKIVVLTERPDVGWIADGLRRGAAAIVPRAMNAQTLDRVLGEALRTDARMNRTSGTEERVDFMGPDPRAAA